MSADRRISSTILTLASVLLALHVTAIHAAVSGPIALDPSLTVTYLTAIRPLTVRVAADRRTGMLYILHRRGEIERFDPASKSRALVFTRLDHGLPDVQGMAIDSAGSLYIVGNRAGTHAAVDFVRRVQLDIPKAGWRTVAYTDSVPSSGTFFDHMFNGIAISPDNRYLFVNSGSRTDHGEEENAGGVYRGMREVPLTSAIFRIPAAGDSIRLRNDQSWLESQGYLFADGTRNSFSLAFDAAGELFGTENSGDRDDPEELNWLRQGRHYGFPWRLGGNWTPMQFGGYDPRRDPLLDTTCYGWSIGTFHNDPAYPPAPAGVTFTEPVRNVGPDADAFRDSVTGIEKDASTAGRWLGTFTPHRSPLGLAFDAGRTLSAPFTGDGFMLSFSDKRNQQFDNFRSDTGEDLLHLRFTREPAVDNYSVRATRIAKGFHNPIDQVLLGRTLYVVQYTDSLNGSMYGVTFGGATGVTNTGANARQSVRRAPLMRAASVNAAGRRFDSSRYPAVEFSR